MRRVYEGDVCIIGSGITAAMVAERLAEQCEVGILVAEAGASIFNLEERFQRRQRYLDYGENPWPDDHLPDQRGVGLQSPTMAVGGLGLHWGGTAPRFTPEDLRLRSLYGVGEDWPLDWSELDAFYQEAEERIGVAGEQGPAALDPRGHPYPLEAMPLSYNLARLQDWAQRAEIPLWRNPVAKNTVPYRGRNRCVRCDTCTICPTGAKYSPDFTWQELKQARRATVLDRTLVRRLIADRASGRIVAAEAVQAGQPDLELRAEQFVLAAGYAWSSHLLLLSRSDAYPNGLANSSGLVGCHLAGHRAVRAFVEVPIQLYPGVYEMDSLLSKLFQRPKRGKRYLRHDLRIWESRFGREARMVDERGELLLGDAMLADWRRRAERGVAQLRAYYDVLPSRDSRLTLDPQRRNAHGDPLPTITLRDAEESAAARAENEAEIARTFARIARAGSGRVLEVVPSAAQDHPAGGCRMGVDPTTSVVDPHGRAHDHPNLTVVGAPTMPSSGCNNGTLTFVALALRSAARLARSLPQRTDAPSAVPHRAEVAVA